MFRGMVRDFKLYGEMLTTRELWDVGMNYRVENIYPNPDCMCSEEFPVFDKTKEPYDNKQRFCNSIDDGLPAYPRSRIELPENKYFFSKDFVNDDVENREARQRGEYWVSTPEIETTSVIIDFQKTAKVRNVQITLFSPLPTKALVIYRRIDGDWKPWSYYASDCSVFNLPGDGAITTFDSVTCLNYQTVRNGEPIDERQISGPGEENIFFPVLDRSRPGFDDEMNWIDDRLLQFLLADAIKVEFQGLPNNTRWKRDDITEYRYHAVSEIRVDGSDYTRETEVCDIRCFPGTEKINPGFSITTPGPMRKKRQITDSCQCECREPFDREKAGDQCTPYIDSINPTYGPKAGGTNIIIRGGLLNSGFSVQQIQGTVGLQSRAPFFIWETCNVTYWNDTLIKCHTTLYDDSHVRPVNESFRVIVQHPGAGTYQLYAPEKFVFRPDPDISEVYPLNSIVQGGVLLTVEGTNFDSVAYPLMRVKIKYTNKDTMANSTWWTNATLCTVRNNTIMVCPTPHLYAYLPPEYIDRLNEEHTVIIESDDIGPQRRKRSAAEKESALLGLIQDYLSALSDAAGFAGQRSKRQVDTEGITINDENLQFTLGFTLDGVPNYQDLETDLPEFAAVDVFVNPMIEQFSPQVKTIPSRWPDSKVDPQIIVGGNMDKGARMNDYRVLVGHQECVVSDLLTDTLTFVPPVDEPDDEGLHSQEGGKIVRLFVGNINRRIGYLKYQGWWETRAFIGIMVALAIVLLIIAAIIFCCWYRRYRDPHYLDMKRRASGNPYVGVPQKERHMLERIDPELRMQIGKALLEDPDNLVLEEEVGKGNFGKVYSGRLLNPVTRDKKHVAVKTVRGDTNVSSIEEFLKEAIVMKNFKHPNVLPLLGVVIKENIPYVILPFMDNGDLKTFVSNEKNRFTVRELVSFGLDVAEGMAYLEEQRFVHRDLAARNCMVDKDKHIMIADFGLARDIYVADYYRVEDKSRPLPIRWMAIESIEMQKFTTKTDVWGFGIVLWELLSRGMKPYPGVDNLDIKRFLKRGDRLEKPSHSPPEVYQVMKKCWETRPEDRPTFRELVGMLENLLGGGRKPEAPPRPKETLPPEATPDSPNSPTSPGSEGYMGMQAGTPPTATYLELVDMPSGETGTEGYLPMK